MIKHSLLLTTMLVGLAAAGPAFAEVQFTTGNFPQANEENILFQTPETGSTIAGATSQTGITVDFKTLTGQTLYQTAQGQADILSTPTAPNSALTSLDITTPGFGFGDFIMNPLNGTGTATVTAKDNLNNTFTYDLGNGQNYLTITTSGGEFITDLTIMMSGGSFQQFKQPRISDLCTLGANGTCTPVPAPEPMSLALLGTGLAGLGLIRRHRKAA